MATTAINMQGSNSSKKEMAAKAAKAAAAVGVGAVAGALGDDILNGEPEVTEEIITAEDITAAETTEEATAQEAVAEPVQPAEHTAQAQTQEHTEGPQPISEETPAETQTPTQETVETAQNTEEVQTPTEEVDPNLIAQEIISGEEIDPEDIDAEDVVNFADVGTIYGEDGHEYAAAVITDGQGNEMVVVDVDNDNEYDIVLNSEGNVVGEMPGHLNVSDAEVAVNSDQTYMAPTEHDLADAGMDDMMQDIITT